jgi:hypothetical protein
MIMKRGIAWDVLMREPSVGERVQERLRGAGRRLFWLVLAAVRTAWRLVVLFGVSVLVLVEPVVRVVLVPLATLCVLMAVVFGFMMHAPHFHAWGMLVFGVGALWLYWLYLFLILWISRGFL